MSYLIAFFVLIAVIIASIIINTSNTTIIYPVYLFNFLNVNIDDSFKTKQIDEYNLLIDDDGLETINYEEIKRLRKEEKITPFYVRLSTNLESYLHTIFKVNYVLLCQNINKVFNVGDYIVVKNSGNYYVREVAVDNGGKVSVYKPEGRTNTEDINRMDIVGKVTSYNKFRVGWV